MEAEKSAKEAGREWPGVGGKWHGKGQPRSGGSWEVVVTQGTQAREGGLRNLVQVSDGFPGQPLSVLPLQSHFPLGCCFVASSELSTPSHRHPPAPPLPSGSLALWLGPTLPEPSLSPSRDGLAGGRLRRPPSSAPWRTWCSWIPVSSAP